MITDSKNQEITATKQVKQGQICHAQNLFYIFLMHSTQPSLS